MGKIGKVINKVIGALGGGSPAQVDQGPSALEIANNERIRKQNIEQSKKNKAASIAKKSAGRKKKSVSGQRVKSQAFTRLGGQGRENTGLAD